jgi:hypothetical protein
VVEWRAEILKKATSRFIYIYELFSFEEDGCSEYAVGEENYNIYCDTIPLSKLTVTLP